MGDVRVGKLGLKEDSVQTHFSKGRVYVKEKLALYVPTGMLAKVSLIPTVIRGDTLTQGGGGGGYLSQHSHN